MVYDEIVVKTLAEEATEREDSMILEWAQFPEPIFFFILIFYVNL